VTQAGSRNIRQWITSSLLGLNISDSNSNPRRTSVP
jgi:hypothetical protein